MTTFDVRTSVTAANPFIGLRPFGASDADVFFGRHTQVGELLARLRDTRFLAVVGASGCGKSSLVLAGLIPALQRGAIDRAGSRWRIATMRPSGAPIKALATALSRPEVLGDRTEDPNVTRATVLHGLGRGERGVIDLVYQSRLREDENLLVIVDQFEELFCYANDADAASRPSEAAAFVKLLLTAAAWTDLPIYVAVTMRSDFIGDCARFRDLPEAVNEGTFLVPRLTRDEMQRAIEEPVLRRGERVAPRLVSRLLDDMGVDSDQLPVLEHALMRTWGRWSRDHAAGEPLDVRHYEAIGEMSGALSQHANALYAGLDPGLQLVAERVFRCLTARDGENRGIRRPTAFGAVRAITGAHEGDVERLVRIYAAPGVSFLTASGPPSDDNAILEISHESLMRSWDRLRVWVDDEADSGKIYGRLVDDATMKRAHWIDAELAVGEAWLKKNGASISAAWAARYDARLNELPPDAPARAAAARGRFAAALAFLAAGAAAPRRRMQTIALVVAAFFAVASSLAVGAAIFYQSAKVEQAKADDYRRYADDQLARMRALADYNQATVSQPHDAVTRYTQAIHALAKPNVGNPNDLASAFYGRGAAYAKLNDKRDARADFTRALRAKAGYMLAARALSTLDHPKHGSSTRTAVSSASIAAPRRQALEFVGPATPPPGPGDTSEHVVAAAGATSSHAYVAGDAKSTAACNRAVRSERFASLPLWRINRKLYLDRKAALDASSQGLADNARCGSGLHRLVNEAYLLGDRAAAKHELGKAWKTDLQISNELLTKCRSNAASLGSSEPYPVLRKVAHDCGTQKRFNERFAAEMSLAGR